MEEGTDGSTGEGSKDRNHVDKLESLKKNKVWKVQKKKFIDTESENNINTVAEELVSSENISDTFWCIIIVGNSGWSIVSTFAQQTVQNCWIYSRSSFVRNI